MNLGLKLGFLFVAANSFNSNILKFCHSLSTHIFNVGTYVWSTFFPPFINKKTLPKYPVCNSLTNLIIFRFPGYIEKQGTGRMGLATCLGYLPSRQKITNFYMICSLLFSTQFARYPLKKCVNKSNKK